MSFPTKNGVSILSPWNTENKVVLSEFLDAYQYKTINMYNLLYVVQSKNDIKNNVYKIGVSSGRPRLGEYVKMHGYPEDGECGGAYLIYLAGTKTKSRTRKTQAGKKEQELIEEYRIRLPWSRKREKQIFAELDSMKFKIVRGKEWYKIPKNRLNKLKEVVTNLTKEITKEEFVIPRKSGRKPKPKQILDL